MPHPRAHRHAPAPALLDRRAWVRYGAELDAACKPAGAMRDAGWPARTHDISAGGVGLTMRHCFKVGTRLSLEIKGADGVVLLRIQARVVHAMPFRDGQASGWLVGCAFDRTLNSAELQLLAPRQDSL